MFAHGISAVFTHPFAGKWYGTSSFCSRNLFIPSSLSLNSDGFPEGEQKFNYKPPKHSDSFLEHVKSVRSAWPSSEQASDKSDDSNGAENDLNVSGSETNTFGVFCTGEPSVDPSRQIQSILDGESDWI
jgi:hypothetical protein